MVYTLTYMFKDIPYAFEGTALETELENQYEPIAVGLALSSAEWHGHNPYGEYVDIHLSIDGERVWDRDVYLIRQPDAQVNND